jgi:hypothetical protein
MKNNILTADDKFITECFQNILSQTNCRTNFKSYQYKNGELTYQGHILLELNDNEKYALNTALSILAKNKHPYI